MQHAAPAYETVQAQVEDLRAWLQQFRRRRGRNSIRTIAEESGLSYDFLQRFARGEYSDIGASVIDRLAACRRLRALRDQHSRARSPAEE